MGIGSRPNLGIEPQSSKIEVFGQAQCVDRAKPKPNILIEPRSGIMWIMGMKIC